MTPLAALHRQAKTHPDRTALVAAGGRWTFQRLADESARLARAFVARGVRPGDRVALHMSNVPESVLAYYACFLTGAIAAPLNTRFKEAELQPLLGRLRPALYLGQAHLYPEVAGTDPGSLAADARFVVGVPGSGTEAGLARPWGDLFMGGAADPLPPDPDPDAVALLFTTSGTTGQPKSVALTATTLAAMTATPLHPALDGEQVELVVMPMVHMLGFYCLLYSVGAAGTAVLLDRFDPGVTLDAIEAHRCTRLFATPAVFGELVRRQREQPRDVRSLRLCVAGGDVLPAALEEVFRDAFGISLRSGLGITEGAWMLALNPRPGTAGQALPGTRVRLVDDAGAEVPRGDTGELLLQSPTLAAGYWKGPGQVEDFREDGWLRTGDLLSQDEDDAFLYVARKKDLIVRGGSNIAPGEVEQVLKAHPAVRDAAVFGIPDPMLGQRVAALVQLGHGAGSGVIEAIRASAASQLADYKLPERLRAVDEIPRNALGKVDRNALQALLSSKD